MAFFGDCTNSQNGGTTSITVDCTLPANCLPGMVLVGGIGINSGATTLNSLLGAATAGHDWSAAVISPSGALPKIGDSQAGNIETWLVYRVLTAQDITDGFVRATFSATGRCYFQASVHKGISGNLPTPPAVAKATAATLTGPTLTTTGNGSDVVCVAGARNAALSTFPVITIGTGFTSNATTGTANAASANLGGATGQLTTPVGVGVSVGGQSISATNTPTQLIAYLVELLAMPVIPQPIRRRVQPVQRRRVAATPVPAVPPTLPPEPARRRLALPVVVRRRPSAVVPAPAVTATAVLSQPRRRLVPPVFRGRKPAPVVPVGAPGPAPVLSQQPRHRLVPPPPIRRRPTAVVPTPVVIPPIPVPSTSRRRFVVLPRRPRQAVPTFVDVLPVSQPRHRVVPPPVPRRRPAPVVPAAVVIAPIPLPNTSRRRLNILPRRARQTALPPATTVTATVPISQPRHRAIQPTRRTRAAQAVVPTAVVAATPVVAQPRRLARIIRRVTRRPQIVLGPGAAAPLTPGSMSSALGPVPTMTGALAPGGMSSSQGATPGMTSTASGSAGMSSAPGPTPSMTGS